MIVVDKDGKEVVNTSKYESNLMLIVMVIFIIIGLISVLHRNAVESNLVSNIMQWEKVEKTASIDEKSSILHAFMARCLQKTEEKKVFTPESLACYQKLNLNNVSPSAFNEGAEYIKKQFIDYYTEIKETKTSEKTSDDKEVNNLRELGAKYLEQVKSMEMDVRK